MLDIQQLDEKLQREPRYQKNGWIGVDLDGTLAKCVSGANPFTIGPPVPLMHKRVRHWIRTGRKVKIFTARAGNEQQRRLVEQWCKEHGLAGLEITDRKDFRMLALWDDRAVGVVSNTGIPILPKRLTSWQRLRLSLSVLFFGDATMAINQVQLRGHAAASVKHGSNMLEN